MSVQLDDIERIEILRGSNSVSYGARAMLGVVNIVTRHTHDTQGPKMAVTRGENGVSDTQLGIGWKTENAGMRLSLDERGDDGLVGSNGKNQVRRLNFRSDWRPDLVTDVTVRAGATSLVAGRGFPGLADRPLRDGYYDANYFQLDWKRVLSPDADVAVMFAHNQENFEEVAPYTPLPGVSLDVSGVASNDSLMAQQTLRVRDDLRLVWGAELRRESVRSAPVFFTSDALITDFSRLFVNTEWHATPEWVVNAGVMTEHSSASGSSVAPRVMVNWHARPHQTLRAGVARSFRPPSTLEQKGDVRYYLGQTLLAVPLRPRGMIKPEVAVTRELGYLADFAWWRSNVDVRFFDEAIEGLSQRVSYALPVGTTALPIQPIDYINGDSFSIRGFEAQWKAKPWLGAQFGASYAKSRVLFDRAPTHPELVNIVPPEAATLFFSQELPQGWQFSLSHQKSTGVGLPQADRDRYPLARTDWRVSKALRFGQQKGELSLTVQNQGAPYPDFDTIFFFERRALVTLRIDN
jgi:iron complex outermembrane recepter protein